MTDQKPMDDLELVAYLQSCEGDTANADSAFSKVQTDALARFWGQPYGNEKEGRSQAMTHEVREQVNWAMPALMRVFQSSDDLVTIESTDNSAIPSQTAKAMADGLNHIFWSDNDGYGNVYDFLFDGLLQRVGIMQVRRKPAEPQAEKRFNNVGLAELQQIMQRGYKLVSHEPVAEQMDDGSMPEGGAPDAAQDASTHVSNMGPDEQQQFGMAAQQGARFNVSARKTKPACIEVRAVPPEEFKWHGSAASLQTADYQQRIERVFLSDLVTAYPDKATEIGQRGNSGIDIGYAQKQWASRNGTGVNQMDSATSKHAERAYLIHEFVRIDFDGDGIVELRDVRRVGTTILYNEAVEASEYHIWSPVRVPHTVAGLSLADDAIEAQYINTSLTRRGLDSLAAGLNVRYAYDTNQMADGGVDALLDNVIGGVIGTKVDPSKVVMPLIPTDVSDRALSWKNNNRSELEQKTGIGPSSNGIDPNNLGAGQSGVATNLNQMASSGRLELIARAAADGLQQVFQSILRLVVEAPDQVRTIQRAGKPPLVIDPNQWAPDASLTLHVAIATASRNSQLTHLNVVAQKQEQILLQLGQDNPLVSMDQYANTLNQMVEAMGFRNSERFFKQIPADYQPPPAPPKEDPAVIAAKTAEQKMQHEQVRLDEVQQADIARKEKQVADELDLKRRQLVDELVLKKELAIKGMDQQQELDRLKISLGLAPGGHINGSGGGTTSQISVGGDPG